MAKALVTGGAGFIGSHLVNLLLARGDTVVVLDDFSTGRRHHLPESHSRLTIIHDSVLNIERHVDSLADVGHVFHLAALISGYESLKEPEPYFETNVKGLLRVLMACGKMAQPRLVFASSSTVYGNTEVPARSEKDLPRPATVYALTKLTGEHLLEMYRDHFGYDDVSLRLFNVYGPGQNRDHPYANVTCKFAWAAATGAPVALFGDGQQSRDFVYVEDVVRSLVGVADRRTAHRLYNVGTGEEASIGSLLELVQEIAGRRLTVDRQPPWPNDIRSIRADTSRLREDLGLTPAVSLRDGLTRTIEHFRTAPR